MSNITVIALGGKSGAGKTTLAKEISKRLNFFYVNCGDYVRFETKNRKLDLTIYNLQRLGNDLVKQPKNFLLNLLKFHKYDYKMNIVIDGTRHIEFLRTIKQTIDIKKLIFVYIVIDETIRIQRLKQKFDNKVCIQDFTDYDFDGLSKIATLLVKGNDSIENTINKIKNYI